jgi:hypothetical protein
MGRKRFGAGACGPRRCTESYYERCHQQASSVVQMRPRLPQRFQPLLVSTSGLHAVSILEFDSMAMCGAARKGAGHGSTLRPPTRARAGNPTDQACSWPLPGRGRQRCRPARNLAQPYRGRQQPGFRNAEADRLVTRRQGLRDRPLGRADRSRRSVFIPPRARRIDTASPISVVPGTASGLASHAAPLAPHLHRPQTLRVS